MSLELRSKKEKKKRGASDDKAAVTCFKNEETGLAILEASFAVVNVIEF